MHNRESGIFQLPSNYPVLSLFLILYHYQFTVQTAINRPRCDLVFSHSPVPHFKMLITLANFLVLSAFTWTIEADGGFRFSDIADNQIYFSKAPRFIKFDSKDDEVEIELGVSIPVVKVPLSPPVGRASAKKESGITVSAPGLVVAGVLMLTTFLVVPLLFSKKMYRAEKTDSADDIWNVMKGIERGFYNNFVNSPCMENLICLTAKMASAGENGSLEKWMDDIMRSRWVTKLVNGTFIEKAISAGRSGSDCREKYNNCSILKKFDDSLKHVKKTKKQSEKI